MTQKQTRKLSFFFLGLLATALLCFVGLLAFTQTNTFQKYLTHLVIEEGEKKGVSICIEELSSDSLFKWSLKKAELSWKDGENLKIEEIKLRVSLFALLKRQVSFSFLSIQKAEFSFFSQDGTPSLENIPKITLFFDLLTKSLTINELCFNDLTTGKTLSLQIVGTARILHHLKEIEVNLSIKEKDLENTLNIELLSSEKRKLIKGLCKLNLEEGKNIANFFNLSLDPSFTISLQGEGPWSFWQDMKNRKKNSCLHFSVDAAASRLGLKNALFLDSPWTFHADLSLWPDLSSSLTRSLLSSSLLEFLGKVSLSSNFTPIDAAGFLTIKDLALLNTDLPLKGEVKARIGLKDHVFLCAANVPALQIGPEHFTDAHFRIEAIKNEGWAGKAFFHLKNPDLPWEGSSEFFLKKEELTFKDCTLKTPKATISGDGAIQFNEKTYYGFFYALIEDLKPFRTLFPNSDLEGKLGGHFSFLQKREHLFINTNLLLKNIRYQSSLIDTMQLEAKIKNIFSNPSGSFSLLCDRLILKGGALNRLSLTSQEKEEKQAYRLEAEGNWKEDFTLTSEGFWKKEKDHLSLHCESLQGSLFKESFYTSPFSLEKTSQSLFLQGAHLQIAEGSLFLEGHLLPEEAVIQTKACHLPLHVLSLFYPTLGVNGYASFQGAFLGKEKQVSGHFLSTLEELDFLQTNKKHPLRAKGSLQLHFSPKHVQICSHLYATQNQFLDWTGTIPLRYDFFPFKIHLEENQAISSELRVQGALEDIFDFLQSASQKLSGAASCHLFLSGTANKPALQGEIDLQKGSYENYISGTRLKDIDITLKAKGSFLEIEKIQAKDQGQGLLSASGSLMLTKNFPYEISGELKELQLMDTKTLLAKATGSLQMKGSTQSAKITGDLQVSNLTFTLSDSLIADIPSISITHINKPIHLQREQVELPTEYPIKLDLSITTEDTVFIKGKGLDSIWTGQVTLTGTPTNPVGKGSLTLKKGEFTFSGKTFKLMQGDLSFSDKPGQDAYLHINGQLQLSGVTIIATMQGPLTAPRLTFQSTPYLPTSSILSLILFNKDISEISPLQTIQLAHVIMSLSGHGGPDVLEAIRKSIGVDRLSIVGKEGSDEISLQIGWYLTHGVTVSLSQSATSSDVTIEVDLKNGFLFEAETQNQEEGKFSLKWNRNY